MIDEVISAIDSVEWDENQWWDKKGLFEIMEKIRGYNLKLREWGNEMSRERDDFEKENEYLRKENNELKQDVEYYKDQVIA